MHFGITCDTSLAMAVLTLHDSILREALLARSTSRRAAALKVAASLGCLEGEIKVPNHYALARLLSIGQATLAHLANVSGSANS